MKTLHQVEMLCVLALILPGCVGPKPLPAAGLDAETTSGQTQNKPPVDVLVAVEVVDANAPVTTLDTGVVTAPDLGPPLNGTDVGEPPVLVDVGEPIATDTGPTAPPPDAGPPVVIVDSGPTTKLDIGPPVIIVDASPPTTFVDTAPPVVTADAGVKKKDIIAVTDTGPAPDTAPVVTDTGPTVPDIAVVPDTGPVVVADAGATPPSKQGLVYGLTLDSVGSLASIVDSLKSMPVKPWVRIVFDYPLQPSDYSAAVAAIAPYAEIIGQPSDSTYNSLMTVAQYRQRFQDYVTQLPQINIWEICNECNGDWLGANASAQADAATDVVKSAGKKALFTPYWNTATCADTHGPYVAWIQKNISSAVKTESDYVTPSIYGMDCDGPEPAYADLDSIVQTFADMFPNALVGIGEYGKAGDATIMKYYMGYTNTNPRYIFAGLYWYGAQDLVPKTKPLWTVFTAAMK